MGGHRRGASGARTPRAAAARRSSASASVDLGRDVAAERVVGRGLVGHEVEPLAGGRPGGLDLGGVADQRDAQRARRPRRRRAPRRAPRPGRRSAGRRSRCRAGAGRAPRRPRWRGTRPRSSSPRAAGRRPSRRGRRSASPSRAASRRSAGAPPRRTSRTCPAGCPGSRCRSTSRRSSGRTSSGPAARARGRPPRSPTCRRGSSWRSGRAAPTGWVRTTPTGLPDWMSRVSSSARIAQLADDRVERLPRACRAPGPAVDDEVVRILGDLGIEVVHEHPQRRFLRPAAAGQLAPARARRHASRAPGRAVSRGHGA